MQSREREFSSLFLDAVLPSDGVHPQPALHHQALTHLHAVLQVLREAAPAHHFELPRRIIRPQAIELHGHLRHRSLVVLGVAHLGRLQHLHLQQAMVHGSVHGQGGTSCQEQPHSSDWIWLFAGTAEGPTLVEALLKQGWKVRLSVVTASAARAYPTHDGLDIRVGACSSDAALARDLRQQTPRWVVDATHPFAVVISERLQRLCHRLNQPLLQLDRRQPAEPHAGEQLQLIDALEDLREHRLAGERLLLAIGARQLRAAIEATPHCSHFARVLDQPISLQAARAAGLDDEHIACLRPDPTEAGLLEQALCRRWTISLVLCRQGGGRSEALWRQVCRQLRLPLLMLRRPETNPGLPLPALLEKLGHP